MENSLLNLQALNACQLEGQKSKKRLHTNIRTFKKELLQTASLSAEKIQTYLDSTETHSTQ